MSVILDEQPRIGESEAGRRANYSGAELKPLAMIEEWAVVNGCISRHFSELEAGNNLLGYLPGPTHMWSPKIVRTSTILNVDWVNRLVETRNTIYRLGKVSDEYVSWLVGVHL